MLLNIHLLKSSKQARYITYNDPNRMIEFEQIGKIYDV